MKIAIIAFSLTGYAAGERLMKKLRSQGECVTLFGKSKYLPDSLEEPLKVWTGRQFEICDGILFIGACGIAVRSIAPYVVSKKTDPAVLVMDEGEKYVISLLSGHLGGANELAERISALTGAVPVVTTATDIHGAFAVDVFAKNSGCRILHMPAAKEVSAALLAGEPVGFYSEFPVEGVLPQGLFLCDREGRILSGIEAGGQEKPSVGVAVTIHEDCLPFDATAVLVPPVAVIGIGCRKGKEAESIEEAVRTALTGCKVLPQAIGQVTSIDLKAEEPGILAFVRKREIPFQTFSAEELNQVPGAFTSSGFVKSVTGVENVCERSAVLASGQGRLIQRKIAAHGVTAALAVREWRVRFE